MSPFCDCSEKSDHKPPPQTSLSPIFYLWPFEVHDHPGNLLATACESVWTWPCDRRSPSPRGNKHLQHCLKICPLEEFPFVTYFMVLKSAAARGSPRVGMECCRCPRSGGASILCRMIYKLHEFFLPSSTRHMEIPTSHGNPHVAIFL